MYIVCVRQATSILTNMDMRRTCGKCARFVGTLSQCQMRCGKHIEHAKCKSIILLLHHARCPTTHVLDIDLVLHIESLDELTRARGIYATLQLHCVQVCVRRVRGIVR